MVGLIERLVMRQETRTKQPLRLNSLTLALLLTLIRLRSHSNILKPASDLTLHGPVDADCRTDCGSLICDLRRR